MNATIIYKCGDKVLQYGGKEPNVFQGLVMDECVLTLRLTSQEDFDELKGWIKELKPCFYVAPKRSMATRAVADIQAANKCLQGHLEGSENERKIGENALCEYMRVVRREYQLYYPERLALDKPCEYPLISVFNVPLYHSDFQKGYLMDIRQLLLDRLKQANVEQADRLAEGYQCCENCLSAGKHFPSTGNGKQTIWICRTCGHIWGREPLDHEKVAGYTRGLP